MKSKKILIVLILTLASICLFSFSNRVNAVTISDDGKYSLVLIVNDENGSIDGEYAKLVRFNIEEGKTTVKLSELTKGIVPFNSKTEFSHWEIAENTKASEELAIANFTGSGYFYTSTGEEVNYTNALTLSAKFSDKELKDSGKYYVTLDAFAGTINSKAKLLLESKVSEFKTIDLSKYIPVREGYTFKGWDLDGKIVTSVNSSAFAKDASINLTATYTQNTYKGDGIVLVLNANGGTIEGKESNKYDYLGGENSGTDMSLLPYVPVREGYTFNGWKAKKDGSGKNYTYIYWRIWDKNEETDKEFEKDTLIKEESGYEWYKNVTLYASWTKKSGETEQPSKETVKEIQSTGETKAKIEFAKEVNKDYKLDIKSVEVKKDLTDKSVKYVIDINVLENGQVVKINNTKMKIRIALPKDLTGFNKYEVVYISNNEIKEKFPAKVEDGYIVFETSHLSQYGVIATNTEQPSNNNTTNNETNNPQTGDNIMLNIMLFIISATVISTLTVVNKKIQSK